MSVSASTGPQFGDRIFTGQMSANGNEVLEIFRGFVGRVVLMGASQGAGRICFELSHDDGSTWTRFQVNSSSALTGGTTGYSNTYGSINMPISGLMRIVIEDTSAATNNFRVTLGLVPLDSGAF